MRVRTGNRPSHVVDYGPTPGRTTHASIAGTLVVAPARTPPKVRPPVEAS